MAVVGSKLMANCPSGKELHKEKFGFRKGDGINQKSLVSSQPSISDHNPLQYLQLMPGHYSTTSSTGYMFKAIRITNHQSALKSPNFSAPIPVKTL